MQQLLTLQIQTKMGVNGVYKGQVGSPNIYIPIYPGGPGVGSASNFLSNADYASDLRGGGYNSSEFKLGIGWPTDTADSKGGGGQLKFNFAENVSAFVGVGTVNIRYGQSSMVAEFADGTTRTTDIFPYGDSVEWVHDPGELGNSNDYAEFFLKADSNGNAVSDIKSLSVNFRESGVLTGMRLCVADPTPTPTATPTPTPTPCGICGCGVPDTDSDGDGVPDCEDQCPKDPYKTVPGVCGCKKYDKDTDGDGVLDCNDDCPNDPNKVEPGVCNCGQSDEDTDGDGTPNCNDECPNDPNKTKPHYCGCGVPDVDKDGDGQADCDDHCPDDPDKNDPGICGCGTPDTDTDSDGTPDCKDNCPSDPSKTEPGTCGCGVADEDTDGDGQLDCDDSCPNDPDKNSPGVCGCGTVDVDTDGDGTYDCNDNCPSDPNKTEPGTCGCGVEDTDTDGDGTPDCLDNCPSDPDKIIPGECGCGVKDIDADGDGKPDCGDSCPNDPNKNHPGVCGCGVTDKDSDGDGHMDCNDECPADENKHKKGECGCGVLDIDSDKDGILDCHDDCDSTKGTCAQCTYSDNEAMRFFLDGSQESLIEQTNRLTRAIFRRLRKQGIKVPSKTKRQVQDSKEKISEFGLAAWRDAWMNIQTGTFTCTGKDGTVNVKDVCEVGDHTSALNSYTNNIDGMADTIYKLIAYVKKKHRMKFKDIRKRTGQITAGAKAETDKLSNQMYICK